MYRHRRGGSVMIGLLLASGLQVYSGSWHTTADCALINVKGPCYTLGGTIDNPGMARTVTMDCGLDKPMQVYAASGARSHFRFWSERAVIGGVCTPID